jgi:hypothetical protein
MLGYHLYQNNKQLYDEIGIDEENPPRIGIYFKNAYPAYEDDTTVATPLAFK